jgi:hypothetical protein
MHGAHVLFSLLLPLMLTKKTKGLLKYFNFFALVLCPCGQFEFNNNQRSNKHILFLINTFQRYKNKKSLLFAIYQAKAELIN